MQQSSNRTTRLSIGDVVLISDPSGCIGVVRHIDEISFIIGIELTEPLGTSDGVRGSERYFTCRPKYGIFVSVSDIARLVSPEELLHKIVVLNSALTHKHSTTLDNESKQNNESKKHKQSYDSQEDAFQGFTPLDLDEIEYAVNKQMDKNQEIEFRMSWYNVCKCVRQEMWPKLANALKSIVNNDDKTTKDKIDPHDLSNNAIDKIIQNLKSKRHLAIEERKYLKELIARSRLFIPVPNNNTSDYEESVFDNTVGSSKDFHSKIPGLNESLLHDIFDVHRAFKFSNYHFLDYSANEFKADIANNGNRYLGHKFVEQYINNIRFEPRFNFHPKYLIQDDIFSVFNYVFATSYYVHYLKNNMYLNMCFELNLIIIPKSITCIYDENMTFKHNIDRIEEYLFAQNVHHYARSIFRSNDYVKIAKEMERVYDIDDIKRDNTSRMVIIIDKRQLNNGHHDILYLFPSIASD
eukprot:332639_1